MIKNKPPDFCLLIPCYNNFKGLLLSLNSVYYYSDRFIILIVDDGSETPVTVSRIKSAMQNDYSVFVLRTETNSGITSALNNGLKWIEENQIANYVARLDCGDICRRDRFYKQMNYLIQHPNVGLLGSWCIFKNEASSFSYQYKTPIEHRQIKRAMYFRNLFIHPTVIFKMDLVKMVGYYPHNFVYTEDYALFWQLLKIGPSHILNEFLVTCELNDDGISLKNRKQQLINRGKTISHYGTSPLLKLAGLLRLYALLLLPQGFLLFFRKMAE
jgi:glycosyltransferase involved in cell wall biosynthesis